VPHAIAAVMPSIGQKDPAVHCVQGLVPPEIASAESAPPVLKVPAGQRIGVTTPTMQ